MSKDFPVLWGVPTEYHGTNFKSRIEAEVAQLLDRMKIKWNYEPKSFLLNNGKHYWPDFYLPDLKTWVEVKGTRQAADDNMETFKMFVFEKKTEMVVLGYDFSLWLSHVPAQWVVCAKNEKNLSEEGLYIGHCSHCGSFFFCGDQGIYHCRKCDKHEGDHDIVYYCWNGTEKGMEFLRGITWS